ncbi:DUF5666 domain-containing protein [Leifsonia sp. WHRI 6310E]|uniref:DUF5666 domain-containing protein n=1 Tax=Leifsonia sp. WHRI 6310E TaxID=3162562 RepID=UPI0032EF4E9E
MDENQPTQPMPPAQPVPPVPPVHEPFYKRHGLAFAISTLVLGIVVLVGIVGVGTVVAVNVVTHSVSAFDHAAPGERAVPGQGRNRGQSGSGGSGSGQGGSQNGNGGTQRELVRGTLESTSDSTWTVKTAAGATVTVKLTSSTAYGLPKQPATKSDFATGDEVVVVGTDRSGDTITATRILTLTDIPRPPSTAGPTPGSGAP